MIEWIYSTKTNTSYKGRIIYLKFIFHQSKIKFLLQANNITKGLVIIFKWNGVETLFNHLRITLYKRTTQIEKNI